MANKSQCISALIVCFSEKIIYDPSSICTKRGERSDSDSNPRLSFFLSWGVDYCVIRTSRSDSASEGH